MDNKVIKLTFLCIFHCQMEAALAATPRSILKNKRDNISATPGLTPRMREENTTSGTPALSAKQKAGKTTAAGTSRDAGHEKGL